MTRWGIAGTSSPSATGSADPSSDTRSYHHGDLRQALIDAAAHLVHEKGPAGFSLREVARRAGVSHAAPAHHFGSTQGLLTAVATAGFEHLSAAMRTATVDVDDPAERLRRLGRAYVDISAEFPGHVALMFRSDIVDHDDEFFAACGMEAYNELDVTLEMVRKAYNPDLDVQLAGKFVWATIQGLVDLSADFEPLDERREVATHELGALIDGFVTLMLDGFRSR